MHRLMPLVNLLTVDAPPTIHLANTFKFLDINTREK